MTKFAIGSSSLKPTDTSVMLLAAGRGSRMRPLTNQTPKPLLMVGNDSLIEHHINALSNAGFKHIVINTAYLGHKIQQHLGGGNRYGVSIDYSDESDTGALETAGGIKQSLALIKSDPFLVVNADIYTDFEFSSLLSQTLETNKLGRLVLVPNPDHNLPGDFSINTEGLLIAKTATSFTFSGIALYRKAMFSNLPEGVLALGPVFKQLINQKRLEAVPHYQDWTDVGTPQRLAQLNAVKSQS